MNATKLKKTYGKLIDTIISEDPSNDHLSWLYELMAFQDDIAMGNPIDWPNVSDQAMFMIIAEQLYAKEQSTNRELVEVIFNRISKLEAEQ